MRVLAIALVIGFTSTLTGQAPQPSQPTPPGQPAPGQPTRMPARPLRPGEVPPKGTAIIRGYVTALTTGTPLRRAQVRAMSMDGTGGGGVTSTDAEGRFEIRELPAGRYSVTAMKGGFVTGQFGQRRPGDPATPIDLIDAQTADKVSFALGRGGVIAGRVLDDGGEPVAGTQVTAVRYAFMSGGRRLMPAPAEGGNDRTDDQGSFRLFGLPPGDYYVSAVNRGGQMMLVVGNNTEADGFAPTYYPGTPNISEATRISLKTGQEMTGANFALIVARMARIRGKATNSRGEPVARTMLMLATDDGSVPAFRPDQVQIFSQPAAMSTDLIGGGPTRVNDDFTFEIMSLFERRLIRASIGQNQGWFLKAVMYDGEDVTDRGMEFTPGRAYEGLEIVCSQKTTDLSGLVSDDRGQPVLDATVVIFAANREQWTYASRFLRTARPDTNGRYNIKSLPPGENYLIIAAQNLESGQGGDPEFLTRAREEAKPLTLNEGETKSVDMKLSKLTP